MLRGLPASIILHGAVIFGGAIAWPYIAPERAVEEFVPVSLDIQLDVVTNIAPVIRRDPEPEPEVPEPEEETIEDVIEEEDPDAEEVEVGEDELETTDVRELEQTPAEEEEAVDLGEDAEEEPEPEELEEPEEKQVEPRSREPDTLEDLLAESDKLFSEVKTSERKPVIKQEKKILVDETQVKEPRKGVGDRSRETAQVEAMIASQMSICWDDVIDLPNPERLNVIIRVALNEDGSLDGDVQLVEPRRSPIGDRPMRVAIERALRAARKCAPYRLPKEAQTSYEGGWDVINFRIGKGFGQ